MKRLFFIPLLFLLLYSYGQSPCDLISSYSLAINKKDTANSLFYLKQFQQLFPNDSLIEEVNLALGDIYLSMDSINTAKRISIGIVNKIIPPPTRGFDECVSVDRGAIAVVQDHRQLQYMAAIDLYKIYTKQQQYDSALYYLQQADTSDYRQDNWCFYWPSDWASDLEKDFYNLYIKKKDYDAAINLLSPYIVNGELAMDDSLYYLLKTYKNIDSVRSALKASIDTLSIQPVEVLENPLVTEDKDRITGRVLRTTTVMEYGRGVIWHFFGLSYRMAEINDYLSRRLWGKDKRTLLKGMTNEELLAKAKASIMSLKIYKLIMGLPYEQPLQRSWQ